VQKNHRQRLVVSVFTWVLILLLLSACAGGNTNPPDDNNPPTLTITLPTDGATVTLSELNVSGNVSDSDDGLGSVSYTLNGGESQPINLSGDTFSFNVVLTTGSNTLVVLAQDASGQETSKTLAVTLQSDSAPIVTITSPASGQSFDQPTLAITGTASDDNGIIKLEYSHNGGPRQSVSGTTSFSFPVTLVAGSNEITVFAQDAAGNEGNSKITATFTEPVAGTFTIEPAYPSGGQYVIAQKANALYYANVIRGSNFTTSAKDFDSLAITASIIGDSASQVKATFRKDLSTDDKLAFILIGGATAPIGSYTITLSATSGTLTQETTAALEVVACSLGCE
jgi:Glucodextranase, domain B